MIIIAFLKAFTTRNTFHTYNNIAKNDSARILFLYMKVLMTHYFLGHDKHDNFNGGRKFNS